WPRSSTPPGTSRPPCASRPAGATSMPRWRRTACASGRMGPSRPRGRARASCLTRASTSTTSRPTTSSLWRDRPTASPPPDAPRPTPWRRGASACADGSGFLALERGEEDDVADRGLARQQHDQAVHAHADPAHGGYAGLHRLDEVLIQDI